MNSRFISPSSRVTTFRKESMGYWFLKEVVSRLE